MPTLQSPHFLAEHEAGTLFVRDKRRVAPIIIGLPFLAAGLGLWGLVGMVVWSHVTAGSIGAPGGYLPIVAMLLAGGAPFLWAGVRLSLHNRGVRIVRAESAVQIIANYVLFQRVTRRSLTDFDAVVLRKDLRAARSRETESGSITAGPHVSLVVDLRPVAPGVRPVQMAFAYDAASIRPLAQLVAQAAGLPFVDDLASAGA